MLDSGLCFVAFENGPCVVLGLTSTRSIFGTKAIQHICLSPKNMLVGSDYLNGGQHLACHHKRQPDGFFKGIIGSVFDWNQFLLEREVLTTLDVLQFFSLSLRCNMCSLQEVTGFKPLLTHTGVDFNCWIPRLCPATSTQTFTGVNQDNVPVCSDREVTQTGALADRFRPNIRQHN